MILKSPLKAKCDLGLGGGSCDFDMSEAQAVVSSVGCRHTAAFTLRAVTGK